MPGGNQVSGGWFYHSFRVSNKVTPNATVQVRFVASDFGNGSIVEAAVDDFRVEVIECDDCRADFNGDGAVNSQDFVAFLNDFVAGC